MTNREVYPNPPIALTVVEIRHPITEPLDPTQIGLIKSRLSDIAPIQRNVEQHELIIAGETSSRRFTKFVSRDKRTNITFRPDALAIETTDYQGFNVFRTLIEAAIEARADVSPIDGLDRIGIRYIDEIRVEVEEPVWSDWVADGLLGPMEATNKLALKARLGQGVTEFETGALGHSVTLRYGAMSGRIVTGNEDLVIRKTPEGPFFLVDIDSSWTPIGMVPNFTAREVLERIDELHAPVHDLFEALISERLRSEVLRK